MTADALREQLTRPGVPVSVPLRVSDLEMFWPSRRGHAFDEFCR